MSKFLSVIFLLTSLISFGQKFHFEAYSLEEGLPRSGVYYILQDQSGFLWVATEGGGICKFDGNSFQSYTRNDGLGSEDVRTLFQDDRGVLWIGTTDGLTYYEGGIFKTLTIDDGLADNFIRSICQDTEGNIWVGTNRGISIIDPDEKGISGELKFNFILPDMKIRALYAQDDFIWIGTDNGLCKFSEDQITVYTTEEGLSNNLILCLYESDEGDLWIGTQDGLNRFSDGMFEYWNTNDGLIASRVRTITEDSYHNIWAGTNEGLSVFDGNFFINLREPQGLTNSRVRCVQRDSFDNIWIGTFFGGIMRFNHQDFLAFTPEYGLPSNQILCVSEDSMGNIIAGTTEGAATIKMRDKLFKGSEELTLPFEGYDHSVRAAHLDKNGYAWYGNSHGLLISKFGYTKHLHQEDGLKNESVTVIKSVNGSIWVGTEGGLAMIKPDSAYENFEIKFLEESDGMAGSHVSNITKDKSGDIWISFADGGLSIFENNRFINPILPKRVKEILSFAIDTTNRIWLGTNGAGIFYGTHDRQSHKLKLSGISTSDNLTSNYIFTLLVTGDRVWSGHEKGLDLIAAGKDTVYVIQSYGPERGFFGLQNNSNAAYKDALGNIWFGTVNGLFYLRGKDFDAYREGKPSINFIQHIQINGSNIDWTNSEWCSGISGEFGLPDDLSLPYNKNNVAFDFLALNFISPDKVKYSWMLEGFDKKWSNPSSKKYASYTNLEPGSYTFHLKSSNEHGLFSDDAISYSFTIRKPFWDYWSFRIAVGIVGLIVWMLFTRMRTRQLIRKKKELESLVEARTEEISVKNQELEIQKLEIEKQNDELINKNTEITDSILYSRRIQQSLLPGPEKVHGILKDSFILYNPKDIVSGDFYWVERSHVNPELIHFSVADCTGHGVPGAMVSLIGTRALNSSILQKKLTTSHEILERTNDSVLESFTDEESGNIIKDGMDIALCSLDYSDKTEVGFDFAGAQNPVWIIRKESDPNIFINSAEVEANLISDGYKLFEIKGDKQPVGYFDGHVPFSENKGTLMPGDRIYMTSDGYADQFGGAQGKKFKYKNLKKLLLSLQDKTLKEQEELLRKEFLNWKGDLEQVDDLCLMGVEV